MRRTRSAPPDAPTAAARVLDQVEATRRQMLKSLSAASVAGRQTLEEELPHLSDDPHAAELVRGALSGMTEFSEFTSAIAALADAAAARKADDRLIVGTVVASSGEPRQGVIVRLEPGGKGPSVALPEVTTDRFGAFLAVVPQAAAEALGARKLVVSVLHPDKKSELARVGDVSVGPGEARDVVVRLPK